MWFIAIDEVPGRLTNGKRYQGNVVSVAKKVSPSNRTMNGGDTVISGLRVAVYDDSGQWMTFNPKVFVPGVIEDQTVLMSSDHSRQKLSELRGQQKRRQ